MRSRGTIGALLVPAAAALIAAVTFLLYHDFLHLSQLGHDSYPIILTARIENLSDLAGTFTEELMDGRYPPGHFYRPVLNLSFALDYAVWGLEPFGYHLTDLIILALSTVLLAGLPRRLLGGAFAAAGFAAALFFLVHPVQLNVLPVPPRRGDTLSLLFMLLALHASRGKGRLARLGPPLFTLLAVGSKETGAITPPLLFAAGALFPRRGEAGGLRAGLRASWPSFAALLPFIAAREVVIGGLGGHMDLTLSRLLRNARFILPEFVRGTLYPYNFLGVPLGAVAARRTIALILLVASIVVVRPGKPRRFGLFLLCWIVGGWAIHAFSGSISPWYVLHTTVPLSLLAGLVLHEAYHALRNRGGAVRRAAGVVGALVIATLFAVNLRGTPPLGFHPEWRDLTILTNRFLGRAEREIEEAPDGSTVELDDLPFGAKYRRGSPIIIAAALNDYTVQAWAELVFPGRKIRVAYANASPPPPAEDELLVVVRAKRDGRR